MPSSVVVEVLAAAVLLANLCVATAVSLRVRRRSAVLALPVGIAVLIAWNALALRALSAFGAVAAPGILAVELLPVALWVAWRRGAVVALLRRVPARVLWSLRGLGWPGLFAVPLVALAGASAWRYAPQNWDSMTYHLARVAHWLQNGSIAPYRTHVLRQNVLGPGAEYLILALQGVSGTDRLANLVQWGCFTAVVLAAPSVARLFGAPRWASQWLAPITAALPMAILQASSTQNDLVAAALSMALIVAAAPFLHLRRARWRAGDVFLLGAVGAAALLVKFTALLEALPVILVAAVGLVRSCANGAGRGRRMLSLVGAVALSAFLSLPSFEAYFAGGGDGVLGRYLYPTVGSFGEKAANAARGLAHHLPVSPAAAARLGIAEEDARSWPGVVLNLHEDYTGNPVHVLLLALLLVFAAVGWRHLGGRARIASASAFAAWFVFHAVLRDNVWISRLQLPFFVLAPAMLAGALAGVRPWESEPREGTRRFVTGARRAALVLPALGAVAWGLYVAVENPLRPAVAPAGPAPREASYYANLPKVAREHETALQVADQVGCKQMGLFIGEDSYDYPLTWRAMQRGLEVRHVFFDADATWPCVVVSDRGPPPAVAGAGWLQASALVFLHPAALRAAR